MPGRVVDSRLEGDARVLTLENDQEIRELIVDVDDEACRLAYAVVAGGRMPITYHHASFQVVAEGPGRSRVVWITDVLPHSLAAQVRVRVEVAAEAMKRILEAQATPAWTRLAWGIGRSPAWFEINGRARRPGPVPALAPVSSGATV